ncbi:hypothetical protein NDU88_004473 [Pleurodeles waltl]|uniref:Uncharacterized protein n=1 Tax=Pleurodeles waltl TaxID=8319 RepID=A0AAV7WSF1_PLEWA|nr:hypothetical protein NDU88_004473 [Pleurodeles waltl]
MAALQRFRSQKNCRNAEVTKGVPVPSRLPRGAFNLEKDLTAASLHLEFDLATEKFHRCPTLPSRRGEDQISTRRREVKSGPPKRSLRDMDIDLIFNTETLVAELAYPPEVRRAGAWRWLLPEREKTDLWAKAGRKWDRK